MTQPTPQPANDRELEHIYRKVGNYNLMIMGHGITEGDEVFTYEMFKLALTNWAKTEMLAIIGEDEVKPNLADATHMTQALEVKWRNQLRAIQRAKLTKELESEG